MTRDTRFTRIENDATEAAYADLCSEAYSVDRDAIPPWFQRCGRANMRVLQDGDEVIAGMMLVPMGLWLGDRSVTMNGVAGLAVRPDRRGASAATTLMTEALREMHQDGFALSGLNASSFRL